MNKMASRNTLIILLAAVTILVVFGYILSLRKQVTVLEEQKQNLAQALSKEKQLSQRLSNVNSALKDNLRASRKEISRLFYQSALVQKTLEKANSTFSILEAENRALREEKDKISQENENLKARLGIKSEFKKAIGQLKREAIKVGRQIRQRAQKDELTEGNHGYMVKDGKSTFPAKIKIEVVPAPVYE